MTIKKYLSISLTFCILISCCLIPTSALNEEKSRDTSIFTQSELRFYEEQLASIHEQLRIQDAPQEIVNYYEDMLYYQTLAYFNKGVTTRSNPQVYAPNGGIATFYYDNEVGHYIASAWTHYNKMDSYDYLLDVLVDGSKFKVSDIIKLILGEVPYAGTVFSLLFYADTLVNSRSLKSIQDCDGYILVQNSRFVDSETVYSVMTGWSTHDYISVPGHVTDVNYKLFS